MVHRRGVLVIAAMAASGACRAPAPSGDPLSGLRQEMTEAADALLEGTRIPGLTLAIAFPDGRSVTVARGFCDISKRTPMPENAVMHAGSVGTTFFAALALQLARDGALDLDAPIVAHVPDTWRTRLPNVQLVTARQLLNHTSGIGSLATPFLESLAREPSRARTPREALVSLEGVPAEAPPGTRFSYSDANYLLLGFVLESAAGAPAYDEIQRRFLSPWSLVSTTPATSRVLPRLVPGYAGTENPFGGDEILRDGALVFDPSFEWAAGGYFSTAGDLAKWFALLGSGAILGDSGTAEAMRGVDAPDLGTGTRYGLGLRIDTTRAGLALGHGGFYPGYVTWVRWYPQRQRAVAIQINTSDDSRITRNIRDLLDDLALR